MVINQAEYPKIDQRSLIQFCVTEKRKPREIYRTMCYVYEEAYFSLKNVY